MVPVTILTMLFFAANSVLARLALRSGEIDAGTFTAVRILAGALALAPLVGFRPMIENGSTRSALILFGYAIAFSYAYLSLPAGTGALILFATVQITMLS